MTELEKLWDKRNKKGLISVVFVNGWTDGNTVYWVQRKRKGGGADETVFGGNGMGRPETVLLHTG